MDWKDPKNMIAVELLGCLVPGDKEGRVAGYRSGADMGNRVDGGYQSLTEK